jgi:mannose-6-phosphate isomerase-like protein (cupin superfamily)
MTAEPVVVHEEEREWETWREDEVAERGDVEWRTLISAGITPTAELTLGVARVPPGGRLAAHRHEQAEVYLVIEGTGVVTIDGSPSRVGPGTSVFIPGNAVHSVRATGASPLRFAYAFAANAFEDVTYVFGQ